MTPRPVASQSRRASGVYTNADGLLGAASPLFVDWAKPKRADGDTKGIAVAGAGIKPRRVTLEELFSEFPPPRPLYIEGIPTMRRDELLDAGYAVWYCNTRELAHIRRRGSVVAANSERVADATAKADAREGVRSPKGDLKDATDLFKFADQIRWYQAVRTEPEVVEAQRLFKNRDLVLGLSKLAAQHAHSESYRDSEFFAETQQEIERRLKEATKAIERFCKTVGLHSHHSRRNGSEVSPNAGTLLATAATPTYGLGCLTVVAALARRPWLFSKQAWRHLNGVTAHAWHAEHAQRRSAGCDSTLKRLIYGGVQIYLSPKSPYRARYDEIKATFETTVKHGKAGHGSYKVTAHAKAFNRAITTPVVMVLYDIVRSWFQGRRASGPPINAEGVLGAATPSPVER